MSRTTKIKFVSTFVALILIGALTYIFFECAVAYGGKWYFKAGKSNLPLPTGNFIYEESLTWPASRRVLSKTEYSFSDKNTIRRTNNFTIVTAFFTLDFFHKGDEQATRGPDTYLDWMWPYQLILNGVVAYFDDAAFAAAFVELRQKHPTKVIIIDRSQLWSFSLLSRTNAVFMKEDYPKNSPKSTSAEYVAAMHAKYELVARAAEIDDPFGSTHVAWMDLGIYRELPRNATEEFMIGLHGCHRDEAILFSRVYPMMKEYTLETVMRNGKDWVGGGFFVARHDVAIRFFGDYVQSVEAYLNQSLANHDQSVLLAMYLPTTLPRPSVPLQAIIPPGPEVQWFYLAMQARTEVLAKQNTNKLSAKVDECSYNIHS